MVPDVEMNMSKDGSLNRSEPLTSESAVSECAVVVPDVAVVTTKSVNPEMTSSQNGKDLSPRERVQGEGTKLSAVTMSTTTEGTRVAEVLSTKRGGKRGESGANGTNIPEKRPLVKKDGAGDSKSPKDDSKKSERGREKLYMAPDPPVAGAKPSKNKQQSRRHTAITRKRSASNHQIEEQRTPPEGTVLVKTAALRSMTQKLTQVNDMTASTHNAEHVSPLILSVVDEINKLLGTDAPVSKPPKKHTFWPTENVLSTAVASVKDAGISPVESPNNSNKKQSRGPPSPRGRPQRGRDGYRQLNGNNWNNGHRGPMNTGTQLGTLNHTAITPGNFTRSRQAPVHDNAPQVVMQSEHPMAAIIRDSYRRANTLQDLEDVIKQAKLYQLSYEASLGLAFMRKKADTNR